MIRDYSKYDLSKREKCLLYSAGYMCIFSVVYLFYHNLIISALSGLIVRFLRPIAEEVLARRRKATLEIQFKDMLYSLSSSIVAGRQMAEAIIEANNTLQIMYGEDEPIMTELRHMKANIEGNKESDKVLLQDFAVRSHSEDIDNFVQVYVTCRNMGGNLEGIIGHTAGVITDKMNIEKEIRVITNQKKLEGRVVALMPIAMLLVMNILAYSYIEPLYSTIIGRLIMTGALITIASGVYIMEKMSRIEV